MAAVHPGELVPVAFTTALMTADHAEQVLAIYQAGIDEGNATFETTAPDWQDFDTARLREHRYVALSQNGLVQGWVAASRVSDRCAYALLSSSTPSTYARKRAASVWRGHCWRS